jgi:hypothetical protein
MRTAHVEIYELAFGVGLVNRSRFTLTWALNTMDGRSNA